MTTYILLFITIICNSIMDAIMSNDSFAKYGLWYSREGWRIKHQLSDWLGGGMIAKFIAEDVLVVFTELYKLAKTIMIISFMFAIFGFTYEAIIAYFVWGLLFSFIYAIIR